MPELILKDLQSEFGENVLTEDELTEFEADSEDLDDNEELIHLNEVEKELASEGLKIELN